MITPENLRRIIREELKRQEFGAVCPECHAENQLSWRQLDGMIADDDKDWTVGCKRCGHEGPPEAFDPAVAADE